MKKCSVLSDTSLILLIIIMSGCASGGDSSPPPSTVTIEGTVDDGTQTSSIANATCRFVALDNTEHAITTADANGAFQLTVPPDM